MWFYAHVYAVDEVNTLFNILWRLIDDEYRIGQSLYGVLYLRSTYDSIDTLISASSHPLAASARASDAAAPQFNYSR